METFKQYRRKQIAELRPYVQGEGLNDRISISKTDIENGSPKVGDMIARNPKNHDDQWLVAKEYFEANFEPIQMTVPDTLKVDVWDWVVTKGGKVVQITDDDMPELPYEEIARKATAKDVGELLSSRTTPESKLEINTKGGVALMTHPPSETLEVGTHTPVSEDQISVTANNYAIANWGGNDMLVAAKAYKEGMILVLESHHPQIREERKDDAYCNNLSEVGKGSWMNYEGFKAALEELKKCKYIKREGESCTLNNNCTYPNCQK